MKAGSYCERDNWSDYVY